MVVVHKLVAAIINSSLIDDEMRERVLATIQQTYPWVTMVEFDRAVERYLATHPDTAIALSELFDGSTLARLANEVAEDEQFCPINVSPLEAANHLLRSIGAPTVVWNSNYRGIEHIRTRVSQEEKNLRRRLRSRWEMNGAKLSHFGIVVWKEVEVLLKVCTRFYSRALSQLGGSSVNGFSRLDQSVTMGQILKAIWGLEQNLDEQTRRECHYLLERSSPFEGLLDRPHNLDLTTQDAEWLEQHKKNVEYLQQETKDYVGSYWGEIFMTDVQVYRNFYAHENEDAVLAAGTDKASRSFNAAKRMLDHILSEQVANGELVPHLVLPVEQGFDRVGRQTVKLVAAGGLRDDGTYDERSIIPIFRLPEWDRELSELHLFQFYLCCPLYELAFNPVLISLSEIRPETLREGG